MHSCKNIEPHVDPKHPIPCILHPPWHSPLSRVTQQCDPSLCTRAGVDTVNEISSPIKYAPTMIIWNWFSFTVVYSAYLRFVWIWSSLLLLLWLQWYHILFSIIVDITANYIGMIHVRCEILTILIEMNWVIFRLDFNYRHRHEAATSHRQPRDGGGKESKPTISWILVRTLE